MPQSISYDDLVEIMKNSTESVIAPDPYKLPTSDKTPRFLLDKTRLKGRYTVYPSGEVYNHDTSRFATPGAIKGRPYVGMADADGKKFRQRADELVMATFGPEKPHPKARIGYIDGDPANCRIENLEWTVNQAVTENPYPLTRADVPKDLAEADKCKRGHALIWENLTHSGTLKGRKICRACTNTGAKMPGVKRDDQRFIDKANELFESYLSEVR